MPQKAYLTFEDVAGEEGDGMTMEMRFDPGVDAAQMASGDLAHSATLRAVRDIVQFVHERSGKVSLTHAEVGDRPEGGERWTL